MGEKYTELADVYSFGLIMWEVVTRQIPFNDSSVYQVPIQVAKGKRPPVPECPASYRKLMKKCWSQKPKRRPSFVTIVEKLKSLTYLEKRKVGNSANIISGIQRTRTGFNVTYGTAVTAIDEDEYYDEYSDI